MVFLESFVDRPIWSDVYDELWKRKIYDELGLRIGVCVNETIRARVCSCNGSLIRNL